MSTNHEKERENALFATIATSRRGFLTRASALLAGLALAQDDVSAQTCPAAGGPPAAGGNFIAIGEIKSSPSNKVLSAIVRVDDEAKGIWLASANANDPSGFAKPFCS